MNSAGMKCFVAIMSFVVPGVVWSDPVTDFLDRFASERNEIGQLTADYEQTTVTPDETIELTGSIVYANTRPDDTSIDARRLIFRYADPALEYMIDGLRAYEYDPELDQLQIFDLEDRPEAEAFYLGFGSNTERLLEAYEVRLDAPTADNPGGTTVTLVPKEPESETAYFERVILHLRAEDFLPRRIHIVNDAESEVVYDISNIATAPDMDSEVVTVFIPGGTNIVQNEEFMGAAPEGGLRFPSPETDEEEAEL